MTATPTTDEVRARTLSQTRAYLDLLRAQDWDAWIELWADDAVLEFPYTPPGRVRVYRGKPDILAYMSGTTESIVIDEVPRLQLIPAADPETMVVELEIDGHLRENGANYHQTYVTVFEFADGLISHYREYWDPTVYPTAMGDPDAWVNEPRGQADA